MERRNDIKGVPRSLGPEQAEELFSKVDNSGHTNAKKAERQRKRREKYGHGVEVDPLSTDDPSGSNVGKVITRVAACLVIVLVGGIIFLQWYANKAFSENTANLSNNVTVRTVADALSGGVEWGNGYTQFPMSFSVQEADQNTGRIEVTVTDTRSENALACFSNAQIQAAALAVNSLLNPHIDTVIYHVKVLMDENGNVQSIPLATIFPFDLLQRTDGELTPFVTFIWTKSPNDDGGVRFNCTISGVDSDLQEALRMQILKEPVTDSSELDELRR